MPMIRDERAEDEVAVRAVLDAAFESSIESDLVDALRAACPQRVSLVAIDEDAAVVGCILFTSVVIEGEHGAIEGYGLAPMAVHPSAQRTGIGSALVRAGLERLESPRLSLRGRRRPSRVLPALRLRACIDTRPAVAVGRHARRGVHDSPARPGGRTASGRPCALPSRVRRRRVIPRRAEARRS